MPSSDIATTASSRAAGAREVSPLASIPTFVSNIAEITDRSPNVREIVLEGGLDRFDSLGADQFVYLMVRGPDGTDVPVDHTMAAQLRSETGTGPIGAYYTVRSWDAGARRMTLWMVRHGHDGSVGTWAESCSVGERVALWGPRASCGGRADATSWLLVADESGLGAVAALLDQLAPGIPARVLVETVDAGHTLELPWRDDITITWLYRGGDDAGTGTQLLSALRPIVDDQAARGARGLVVFGAGETAQMIRLRRYLRHTARLPAERIAVTGYWRRQPS